MKTTPSAAIETFRRGCDPETLKIIDALRSIIRSSDERLVEDFKWNAPSYRVREEHRVTLGLQRAGGVRLVLHRGARPKDHSTFVFDDADGIAEWPSPDRGFVTIRDVEQVNSIRSKLEAIIRRWVAVTEKA